MALLDDTRTEIAMDAEEIKDTFRRIVTQNAQAMKRVQNLVAKHGTAAMGTEVAPDGAELQTMFNTLRDFVQAHSSIIIDPLP